MTTGAKLGIGLGVVSVLGIIAFVVIKNMAAKDTPLTGGTSTTVTETTQHAGALGFLKGVLPEGMKVSLA